MDRLEADERATGEAPAARGAALTLEEWRDRGRPEGVAVTVSGDADLDADYAALARVAAVTIDFPAFMDGRGFSHARKLRLLGFDGQLIAAGDVLPDQWTYLKRCGFSSLASAQTREVAGGLTDFSDGYQSHSLQPQPLFRRRPA